jgi:hypothetical protein
MQSIVLTNPSGYKAGRRAECPVHSSACTMQGRDRQPLSCAGSSLLASCSICAICSMVRSHGRPDNASGSAIRAPVCTACAEPAASKRCTRPHLRRCSQYRRSVAHMLSRMEMPAGYACSSCSAISRAGTRGLSGTGSRQCRANEVRPHHWWRRLLLWPGLNISSQWLACHWSW